MLAYIKIFTPLGRGSPNSSKRDGNSLSQNRMGIPAAYLRENHFFDKLDKVADHAFFGIINKILNGKAVSKTYRQRPHGYSMVKDDKMIEETHDRE